MKLAKLKIRNFRCFGPSEERYEWLPNKDLNLLIGPNGSGKTVLADAIDIVMNWEGRTNRALITEYDFPCCDTSQKMEIEVTLIELGNVLGEFESYIQFIDNKTIEPIDENNIEPNGSEHQRGIIIKFEACSDEEDGEIKWRWFFPKFVPTEFEEHKELKRLQHEALGYFRINPAVSGGAFTLGQYSALGRHLRKLNYKLGKLPDSLKPKHQLPRCILGNLDCENCPEKQRCLNEAGEEDVEQNKRIPLGKRLNEIVSKAENMLGLKSWSEMQSSLGPRFGGLRSSLAAITLGLRPAAADNSESFIPFEKLSAGEKYALSFSLATTQIPDSLPPIIIMEEPETALYPSAIGQIITELQSSNSPQVIITTHSESVLRYFSLDHVFVLDSSKQPPKKLKDTLEDDGFDRLQLESLIMPGKTSALFVEKVVVAEGAIDTIVSGELDRLAGKIRSSGEKQSSFASKNWCFFDPGGAPHVAEWAGILRKLGKKVVVLFDADEDGRNNADITKSEYPTFIYKSSKEPEPTLELSLLYGLENDRQKTAINEFQSYPECQNCTLKIDLKNCLKLKDGGCPLKLGKNILKSHLCHSCLKQYYETNTFPSAFSELLEKIDMASLGSIIELNVEKKHGPLRG